MAINTQGFDIPLMPRPYVPVDPQLVAGFNSKPAVEGAMSALQLGKQANENKYLQNIEPSQEQESIATNLKKAGQAKGLAALGPIQSTLIDQGQGTKLADNTTTKTYNPDGTVTEKTSANLNGTPLGSTSDTISPTSDITKIERDPGSGENIQNTYSYILKPDAPKGSVAVKFNPATGQSEPTEFAQQVGSVKSTPVAHYAPTQRNDAGAQTDTATRLAAAKASGQTDLSNILQAQLDAEKQGASAKVADLKAKADLYEKKAQFAGVKTAQDADEIFLDSAQGRLDDLKAANAGPEAINRAQGYVDGLKASIKSQQDQAAAKVKQTTGAAANQEAQAAANRAKPAEADAKQLDELTKTKIKAWQDQSDILTKMAAGEKDDTLKAHYLSEAHKRQDQIIAATSAASGVSPQPQGKTPTPADIQRLQANPQEANLFEQVYGKGSSSQFLQQTQNSQ